MGDIRELDQLVQQRHAAAEEEKNAKAVKDALSKEILELMTEHKVDTFVDTINGITCVKLSGKTGSKLDEKLLLANGVDADIIKASTVEGKPYSYIQTKGPKEQ